MGSDSGHWFSMDLFCPSTHNASGRDGMRMIKAGLACDALVPPLPIHHSPQLVNSPQIHYQPSASFSKIFFHLSMIYCPLPPSYSLEIPSSALSSSSPVSCL